jgi:hypothetical protein
VRGFSGHPILSNPLKYSFPKIFNYKALFTFKVFEGIISYPEFTRPGFEGIIRDIPINPLHTSLFLARLKTLHHGRVFFRKGYLRVWKGIG